MSNSQHHVEAAGQHGPQQRETDLEQVYVTRLYDRLDVLRGRTAEQLHEVLRRGSAGTHQARSERDALATAHGERLAQLSAVEHGLCFGRLDRGDGSRFYVGRVGLSDDDYEAMLVDWRAPVARPFYSATPAAPDGAVLRRHIRTRGRSVVAVDDDPLDLAALDQTARQSLNGEAALLASLADDRTGRMADIVATIQVEQDRIIRSDLSGVLVVQGGPGTGKTVVALHRVAYLLYTHRHRLARRGVLVVGPNPTFLHYIDQVLPALGETEVLLSTVGRLFPGVVATGTEPAPVAAVKGDPRMAAVVRAAVRNRQWIPDRSLSVTVDGDVLRLDRATCERARGRARRSRQPHNQARPIFEREILTALARQMAGRSVRGALDGADLADLRTELAEEPAVRVALDRMWPRLSPQRLLVELYASAKRLFAATTGFTEAERALLHRESAPDGPNWTPADVPLLDEAAELLGDDSAGPTSAAHQAEREWREQVAYARQVLDNLALDEVIHINPELLADQYRGAPARETVAERAEADRTWTFGHVIVDEAQELSPMAWRMLMRRCPGRSMTVVGDLAQSAGPAGARSWAELLDPHAAGHWRLERLTLNYRTPVEIMAVAADVLASVDPTCQPPVSVRSGGTTPWSSRVGPDGLAAELARVLVTETAALSGGRLAVLAPDSRLTEVAEAVAAALPDASVGYGQASLDAPVAVLSVAEAKGLEFDGVVVVEPADMLDASPRGGADLYVALTRATRRLGVVHTGELPVVLAGCQPLVRPA